MFRRCLFPLHLLLCLTGAHPVQGVDQAWEEAKAVLQERCTKCHGGVKHKGGLDLRAEFRILQGGESGPVVVPGEPEASLLIEVLHPEGDPSMPPKGDRLTGDEIAAIARWIESLNSTGTNSRSESVMTFPTGMSPQVVIDFLIERGWQAREVRPSEGVDDAGFVRRVYLHLLGRIPTVEERRTFLRQTSSAKRTQLVDQLLDSPGFARHFAEIFNVVFLGREHGLGERERPLDRGGDWHDYLFRVFETNRPWNAVARDLLHSGPREDEARGARWYLAAHRDKHEDIAKAVAPALLGKQIGCAQCHNHPLVPEIEQRHYWGLVAFFKRSFNVETKEGLDVGESAAGGDLKFSSLEGNSHEAALSFFDGTIVKEPEANASLAHDAARYEIPPTKEYFERLQAKKGDDKAKKKGRKKGSVLKMAAAPVPHFSRREALADLAVENYPDFASAFVNRLWALLLGRGLVHPVDHLDSAHPPSHPDLLAWLGQDFAAHGYDVKRLIRAIMLSRVYQLSSTPAGRRPPPESFASASLQPLSAEVLYRSMLVAGGHELSEDGLAFDGIDEEQYIEAFARIYPDLFPETYSPRASEGMFFSNNPMMREIMVRDLEGGSAEQVIEDIFEAALGRAPDASEGETARTFLQRGGGTASRRALLWALITSAEFRFNH